MTTKTTKMKPDAQDRRRRDASPLLVILPSRLETGEPVSPELMLLGLPLIRRSVLAAARAGIDHVVVMTPAPAEMKSVLEGAPAAVISPGEPITRSNPGRVLLLATNVLPDSNWLRTLVEMPLEREQFYRDSDVAAVIDVANPRILFPNGPSCHAVHGRFMALAREFTTDTLSADQSGRFVLGSPDDVRAAEDWLLERLVKDNESFLCRHFERRLSLAISRRLASTSISPNAITLFSLGLGLLSAPFFLSSQAAYQFTGAVLFVCHAIVDGCDGELARLKFQESRWGMILDLWGDNLVHAAVFSCIGIGWSLAVQAKWPLLVAGIAVAGTLATAWVVYRQTLRWTQGGIPAFTSVVRSRTSAVSRIMHALGNRDFIYLVLLLSAFGKAHWFLPMAAVGSPIFFLVLLRLSRKE